MTACLINIDEASRRIRAKEGQQGKFSIDGVSMRISSYEELSGLIGRIYDCSLDPSLWYETLGDIVAASGATCGQIGVQDPVRMKADFAVEWGVEPEYAQLYAEKFITICPFLLTPYFTEVGEVISVSQMIDRAEFQSSRFYREWCRPQSVEDFLAGIIMKSAGAYGGFSLSFPEVVDDDAIRLHGMLLPHVRRAVTIGRLLSQTQSQTQAFETTIDALSSGVLFLDGGGTIVRTNPAADALLDDSSVIRKGGNGRLVAANASSNDALRHAIEQLSHAGLAGAAQGGMSLALRRFDGASGLVAHLLPAAPATHRANLHEDRDASLILFIQNPEAPFAVPGKAFVDLYGITAGELRVLLGLIKGQTATDIASEHGIGLVTVRTHIQSLFSKTGTKRQADLLRRVMTSAPALANASARGQQTHI